MTGADAARASAWQALAAHHAKVRDLHLRSLFAEDPRRGERLCAEAAGLVLDYSKHRITDETLRLLIDLARAGGLDERIDAMFRGARINATEQRAALHVALRMPPDRRLEVEGEDVVAKVHAVLARMQDFCERVRSGAWQGHGGRKIRNVVNLGIGGSDLGPAMACEALLPYADPALRVRFVANVDAADFALATRGLDPAETLFLVASKTFTTPETLANARSARRWCVDALRDEAAVARHFVAITSNPSEAAHFGIEASSCFEFWDWVGGRYSLASAVGLSLMLAIGPGHFRALLAGMHAMDEHFRTAPFERNLPVLMGLLRLWYGEFFGAQAHAVIPYAQPLRRFPAYLQQLVMESNGKHVTAAGAPVEHATGPVVFGEPGTNAQHSFFQLLHQGTQLVPCDFIAFATGPHALPGHREPLLANCFAQSEALAFGKPAAALRAEGVPERLVPHRSFEGNRPSSTLLAARLSPDVLGALVALYEHSVFTQAVIWGIDPFDQFGVELGKALAGRILPQLERESAEAAALDSSTRALIRRYWSWLREPS